MNALVIIIIIIKQNKKITKLQNLQYITTSYNIINVNKMTERDGLEGYTILQT